MNLKKIMTDLAAGHITKKEVDKLVEEEKVAQETPVQEIEEEDEGHSEKQSEDDIHSEKQNKIQKRTKSLGGKK